VQVSSSQLEQCVLVAKLRCPWSKSYFQWWNCE